jgi:hypothetical protein
VGAFELQEQALGEGATCDRMARSDDGQRHLRVIRQMLGDMEVQTLAGQRHTMGKVVVFLRSRIHERATAVTPRNQHELLRMVNELDREARRQAPNSLLFGDRTEALVLLLSAAT